MCCHVAQVWEGKGVVASARKIIGATNPLASEPGTIRGDFAIEVGRNVVHGSDSPENGERETGACVNGEQDICRDLSEGGRIQYSIPPACAAIWFGKEGIVTWDQTMTPWLKEEGRE